jgi:hypothetical protein
MMKMKTVQAIVLMAVATILFQCKSASEVEPDDENELITTVLLKFTETGTSTTTTVTYRDIDGDGGNPPTRFDQVVLKSNTAYALVVEVLDESKNPAIDITGEIKEKADEHLFIFTPNPSSLLTYTYGDKDARNLPLGLTGVVNTAAAGVGMLKVQLRHQPAINGSPVKDGTSGPGSDDVNIDFSVEVK